MMITAALLSALIVPAAQAAPDEDPVRVALYGRPVEVAVADLVGTPGSYVGRAVQVRGRVTIASAPGAGTRVETVVPPM